MTMNSLVEIITQKVIEEIEKKEKKEKILIVDSGDALTDKLYQLLSENGYEICHNEDASSVECSYVLIPYKLYKPDNNISNKDIPQKLDKSENCCSIDKKILTEADIQKIARKGCKELLIGKKAIVTPLAEDSIKIHGISIKRQ